MELYKKSGANPFGGCLPLLVQFPIIIALFNVLRSFPYQGAPYFLGLNLSLPDPHNPALRFAGGVRCSAGVGVSGAARSRRCDHVPAERCDSYEH